MCTEGGRGVFDCLITYPVCTGRGSMFDCLITYPVCTGERQHVGLPYNMPCVCIIGGSMFDCLITYPVCVLLEAACLTAL